MLDKSLYIGIPIMAFGCFLFLLFCFMNTPKSRVVHYFRVTLLSCLLWTGGSVFMRLQASPGLTFWYHIALLGILMIPNSIYYFLFEVLDIRKPYLLPVSTMVTVLLVLINIKWEIFCRRRKL